MENRYEPEKQELQPLQQEWKHYLPPEETHVAEIIVDKELLEEQTVYPTKQAQQASLCLRVRERLQSLLEEDYEMRPEMAAALYGHLALCHDCAFEFEEMQRVVQLLKSIPMAEIPMDYSKVIMQRIIAQEEAHTEGTPPHPTRAASSLGFSVISEEVADHRAKRSAVRNHALNSSNQSVFQNEILQKQKRIMATVALSGVFVLLMATRWGRELVGAGLFVLRQWAMQLAGGLRYVPAIELILDILPA